MNVREVLEFAKKHRVQMVDLKFIDLPGVWQHIPKGTQFREAGDG